ncbi:MAG: glycosyltransferase family 2 protein [Chthoniobacterales bacterium]
MSSATNILSVLIVTYQSLNEIVGCLESIPSTLSQGAVEVILVDNDSGDGTAELVEQKFRHVTLIRAGGNLGFSRSNNLAFARSTGQVILYLNPDTIVNPDALESCLTRVINEPNLGIISPKLVQGDGTLDLACRRSIPSIWDGFTRATGLAKFFPKVRLFAGYNLTYLPDNETYPVGCVNGAFMMVRRNVLDQIGLLDEQFFMYGEDLDLCYRCQQAGFQVIYDGRHTIVHLKGQSSAKNYRAASRQIFIATEQFYQKNFNPRNSYLTRLKYRSLFFLWRALAKTIAVLIGYKRSRPL